MSEETEKKPRGRKPAEAPKEAPKEGNIENLPLLKEEYTRGLLVGNRRVRMPERKLIALRTKLVSLYHEGAITPDEQGFMELILRKDRSLGQIDAANQDLLNIIEQGRCERSCVVKTDDAPIVHNLHKGLQCRFNYDPDYNDGKAKPDSIGRYYVYVPVVIPTRHQLSNATVMKENLGHPTSEKDYPAPRTVIKRLGLKEAEFNAWFEEEMDHLSGGFVEEVEPSYQF